MCLRGVIRLRGEIRLRFMCLQNVFASSFTYRPWQKCVFEMCLRLRVEKWLPQCAHHELIGENFWGNQLHPPNNYLRRGPLFFHSLNKTRRWLSSPIPDVEGCHGLFNLKKREGRTKILGLSKVLRQLISATHVYQRLTFNSRETTEVENTDSILQQAAVAS